MGMAQFAKVVLLPQGDFAAFLRATPDDRREVLERLFDISAFSDVEAWLAQARRTAGADLELARSALASVVARADDVLAQAGSAADGPPVAPESVATHLHAVADQLDARVSTTMAAFDTASGAERAAAEALATARRLDELRTRGLRAAARLAGPRGRCREPRAAGGAAGRRRAGGRPGRPPHRTRPGARRPRPVSAAGREGAGHPGRSARPCWPTTTSPRRSPRCRPSTTPSRPWPARPTTARGAAGSGPSSTTRARAAHRVGRASRGRARRARGRARAADRRGRRASRRRRPGARARAAARHRTVAGHGARCRGARPRPGRRTGAAARRAARDGARPPHRAARPAPATARRHGGGARPGAVRRRALSRVWGARTPFSGNELRPGAAR